MAKRDESRIYWDSNLFIGWLMNDLPIKERCEGVLQKAVSGEIKIVTSAYTLTEVLGGGRADEIPAETQQKIIDFFKQEFLVVVDFGRSLAEYARQITWDHKVPKKDSIHVATALTWNIPIVQTFDAQLLTLTGKIPYRGNKFAKLKIEEPNEPVQRSLFDAGAGQEQATSIARGV